MNGYPTPTLRALTAELDREEAVFFKNFLKTMREGTDPGALGVPTYARRLTRRGITQTEIAQVMGISEAWYRRLENSTGDAHWTQDLADAFAAAVRMEPLARTVLYALALGRDPHPLSVDRSVSEETRATIDMWPGPAYLSDELWTVLYRNARLAHNNPDLELGVNVMTWMLTSSNARKWMVNYEKDWVKPMFAQLRTAWMCAQGPTKQRLRQMIDNACRANDLVARLWLTDRTLYEQPSGDIRRINMPLEPPQTVRLFGSAPLGHPAWRIIFLEPYDPPEQRTEILETRSAT